MTTVIIPWVIGTSLGHYGPDSGSLWDPMSTPCPTQDKMTPLGPYEPDPGHLPPLWPQPTQTSWPPGTLMNPPDPSLTTFDTDNTWTYDNVWPRPWILWHLTTTADKGPPLISPKRWPEIGFMGYLKTFCTYWVLKAFFNVLLALKCYDHFWQSGLTKVTKWTKCCWTIDKMS